MKQDKGILFSDFNQSSLSESPQNAKGDDLCDIASEEDENTPVVDDDVISVATQHYFEQIPKVYLVSWLFI